MLLCFIAGFSLVLMVVQTFARSLGFDPISQITYPGDLVNVDVVISGLHSMDPDEIVGGYDLWVEYNSGVLSATDVAYGTFLGGPSDSFQGSDLSTPGVINLAELSLLSDAALNTLQPDTFKLCTLSFNAEEPGTSILSFALHPDLDSIDVKGLDTQILDLDLETASVNVVPVPGSIMLLGSGLVGIVAWSRTMSRRRKNSS